jgi:hypothetical protein
MWNNNSKEVDHFQGRKADKNLRKGFSDILIVRQSRTNRRIVGKKMIFIACISK